MKNAILLLLLSALAFTSNAQLRTLSISAASDTLTVGTSGVATIRIDGYAPVVSFQTVITETSAGTTAGTATLQGSHDNTTWITVPGTSAFTVTDVASQTTGWVVAPSSFQYYRINFVNTTGTWAPVSTALIRRLGSK